MQPDIQLLTQGALTLPSVNNNNLGNTCKYYLQYGAVMFPI